MRIENIQRIVLTIEDLRKAKMQNGLRVDVPPNTTEIMLKFEGNIEAEEGYIKNGVT